MRRAGLFFAIWMVCGSGCVYRIGRNFTDGILDEAISPDREGGIDALGDRILQKQLAAELGAQLGQGLTSGATDITPEQRAKLEATIDGLLEVATAKGGDGIRRNLSPAVRDMVRQDIIQALADGLRDEVSPSLENTADRVVTRAVLSLRTNLEDPDTKLVISELLADSFYMAMREGGRQSPGIGDTLETTMTQNVLSPFEDSMGDITNGVALKFEEQAKRTENTLRAIIVFLALVIGVFMVMYAVVQRQLLKERTTRGEAEQGLRHISTVIGMLDEETRAKLTGVLDERALTPVPGAPVKRKMSERRDDYARGERRDDYARKKPPTPPKDPSDSEPK